jgi:flavoprotein
VIFSVELVAGPVPATAEVADVAGRLSDAFVTHELLDAAVGGRLDHRTIGITAVDVEASDVDEALHAVVGALSRACDAARMPMLPILRAEVSAPNAAVA